MTTQDKLEKLYNLLMQRDEKFVDATLDTSIAIMDKMDEEITDDSLNAPEATAALGMALVMAGLASLQVGFGDPVTVEEVVAELWAILCEANEREDSEDFDHDDAEAMETTRKPVGDERVKIADIKGEFGIRRTNGGIEIFQK